MLLPGVKSNCGVCYKRPSSEGGAGTCPFSTSVRRAYAPQGKADNCPHYDEREYVPPRVKKELSRHPQDEGLF